MITTYIGLGSNLGESRVILSQTIQALNTLGEIRVSRLYSSPPMGPQDQPDYLNAVVELRVDMNPIDLLDQLQRIENESGRIRLRRWGERTLDLDLLLYGIESIQHPRLTVPHIGMIDRDFVVLPLLDVASQNVIEKYKLTQLNCILQPSAQVIAEDQWYLGI